MIQVLYDPKNNKSTYIVNNQEFVAKFWDEAGFVKGAYEPFYAFLKEAGISEKDIEKIKPLIEDGSITTVDVIDEYFGEDITTFVSELFERAN